MDYKQFVADTLAPALTDVLSAEDIYQKIERPKDTSKGDYAFPAFTLAKTFKKAPQQIAADLVKKIDTSKFEKVEVAGPYLNFFLDKTAFSAQVLNDVLTQGADYGQNQSGNNGNVPIDMSSPNIAKPISMGHLRSTVIGNSIAEILRKNGYNPIKDNHLGDWGTQFGKLITAYLKWGNEEDVKKDPITNLVKYYVKFHKEDVEHPELDDEAREWFRKLENGDEEAHHLWSWFRDESLKAFNAIYDKLGVKFDTYNGEAFYNDKMQAVIDTL
ncbi:MAG TPA: arginine--tRNA ligase, partial [Lactobacillus sp.]|nr:arginine--tRNA ligase [Lactobacillus sp.]